MKFKKTIENFFEENEMNFKGWYEKHINSIERSFKANEIAEDEAMDEIVGIFRRDGLFLKDSQKRDLKEKLF